MSKASREALSRPHIQVTLLLGDKSLAPEGITESFKQEKALRDVLYALSKDFASLKIQETSFKKGEVRFLDADGRPKSISDIRDIAAKLFLRDRYAKVGLHYLKEKELRRPLSEKSAKKYEQVRIFLKVLLTCYTQYCIRLALSWSPALPLASSNRKSDDLNVLIKAFVKKVCPML